MMDVFIPTCQRDLPQMHVLLRSLDTFLELPAVSSMNLAALGGPEVFDRVRQLPVHKFRPCTTYLRPSDLGLRRAGDDPGRVWKLQQAAKLSFARYARTEFYMVLDSKNLALRPVRLDDMIRGNRACWIFEPASIHAKWWRGSAWALAHRRFDMAPERTALSSATPAIFHTASVVAMITWLERHHGESLERFFTKVRPIRDRLMRATEFTLYYVYMDREGLGHARHFVWDRFHDSESQIWISSTPAMREERLRRILGGRTTGLFTGIHFSTWVTLPEAQRAGLHAVASGARPRCIPGETWVEDD